MGLKKKPLQQQAGPHFLWIDLSRKHHGFSASRSTIKDNKVVREHTTVFSSVESSIIPGIFMALSGGIGCFH
jgi:hypothetical protein